MDLFPVSGHPAFDAFIQSVMSSTVTLATTVPLDTTHDLLSKIDSPPSFWATLAGSVWSGLRLVVAQHPITVIIWGQRRQRNQR